MAMLDPDPRFFSKTAVIQLGHGVWVNLAYIALGLAHGFPAIQVPQLNQPGSSVPMTTDELSWVASIMPLFAPIGCFLSGFLMDRFGRKPVIVACEVPICIGWIYTACSSKPIHVIIGRAITGVGCGMAMGAPRLYIAEISLANMRGLLGAFPNMFISIGMSIQGTMGSFLSWETISFICGGFNFCLLLSFLLLTETPYFLILRGEEEKARRALHTLRAESYNVDAELDELIEFKEDNNIRSLTFRKKLKILCTGACCKPFSILMLYVVFGILSGFSIVTYWTVELLMISNSSVNAYAGNVALNLTRLVFGLLSSVLLYHVGRRTMAVSSAFGVGVACVALGVVIYNNSGPTVLPQIMLMMYMAFSSLGFLSLPFLLMSEMFPLQVRGILISISISLTNLMVFFSAKTYPFLRDNFGISNSFFLFGTTSIIGALYLYFYLPETKGLTLQEIEEYYNSRRPTLVSDRVILSQQLGSPSRQSNLVDKSSQEDERPPPVHLPEKAEKSALKRSSTSSNLLSSKKSVSFSNILHTSK